MSATIGTRRKWGGQFTLNAATPGTLKAALKATSLIYITKITLSIITHAAGKLVSVQDTAGSPVTYAKHLDAAAGSGVLPAYTWDFGTEGVLITAGKDLTAVSEASGVAGIVYAEGYEMFPAPTSN